MRSLRASGLVHLKSPFGLRVAAAAAAAAVAPEGEVGADGVVFSILHHSKHGHQLRTKTSQTKIERIVFSLNQVLRFSCCCCFYCCHTISDDSDQMMIYKDWTLKPAIVNESVKLWSATDQINNQAQKVSTRDVTSLMNCPSTEL